MPPSISDMPQEILRWVLQMLDASEMLSCASVCKAWKEEIGAICLIQKKMLLGTPLSRTGVRRDFPDAAVLKLFGDRKLHEKFHKQFPAIEHLVVRGCHLVVPQTFIRMYATTLRSLSIDCLGTKHRLPAVFTFHCLQHYIGPTDNAAHILISSPHLLSVSDRTHCLPPDPFPLERRLDRFCDRLTSHITVMSVHLAYLSSLAKADVAQHLKSLTVRRIWHRSLLASEDPPVMSFPVLESLSLRGFETNVIDQTKYITFPKLKRLEILVWSDGRTGWKSDESEAENLPLLISRLRELEQLSLTCKGLVTDSLVSSITRSLPRLKRLSLESDALTDLSLVNFAAILDLKELIISYAGQGNEFSEKAIQSLLQSKVGQKLSHFLLATRIRLSSCEHIDHCIHVELTERCRAGTLMSGCIWSPAHVTSVPFLPATRKHEKYLLF